MSVAFTYEPCPHCKHETCTRCGRPFPHSRNECDANLEADREPNGDDTND